MSGGVSVYGSFDGKFCAFDGGIETKPSDSHRLSGFGVDHAASGDADFFSVMKHGIAFASGLIAFDFESVDFESFFSFESVVFGSATEVVFPRTYGEVEAEFP